MNPNIQIQEYHKHVALKVLIGGLSLLIVAALAIGISVMRSYYENTPDGYASTEFEEDTGPPVSVEQRAEQMHQAGNSNPTTEQIERMQRMDSQTSTMTEAERRTLLESMQ